MQPISQQFEQEIQSHIKNLRIELKGFFDAKIEAAFRIQAVAVHEKGKNFAEFVQSFLQRQRRLIELNAIGIHAKEAKKKATPILSEFFEDRSIAEEKAFKKKSAKTTGASAGYVAVKTAKPEGASFMVKKARKSQPEATEGISLLALKEQNKALFDSMKDRFLLVNEFVSTVMYRRALYGQASIVELVLTDAPNCIMSRSKFLQGFKTLSEFSNSGDQYRLNPKCIKLREIENTEKVMVTLLVLGEADVNAGNLGVTEIVEEGKPKLVLAKIDHGFTATKVFKDAAEALTFLADTYKRFEYYDVLRLNVSELKKAAEEIISISDSEIETLIKARVYELKRSGFDIANYRISPDYVKGVFFTPTLPDRIFTTFEELEEYYVNYYKQQINVMRQVRDRLDIIAHIDGMPIGWKNGRWLQDIKGDDPIAWTVQHGKLIEGKNPVVWAELHNKLIEGDDPIAWTVQHGKLAVKGNILTLDVIEVLLTKIQQLDIESQGSKYLSIKDDILSLKNNLQTLQQAINIRDYRKVSDLSLLCLNILEKIIPLFSRIIDRDQMDAYKVINTPINFGPK